MATTMRQNFPGQGHAGVAKTSVQKLCIIIGVGFIVAGLGGIMMPGMLGMHLSMAHNLIHLASGALALWAGYADSRKSYTFCIAFGAVYGLLGVLGFLIGEPGYPGVGHMEADQNLLRVVPNVLEFGSSDHAVHIFLGAVLLAGGFLWKRRHNDYRGTTYRGRQTTRPEVPNSDTDLADADLGRSDVNRTGDLNRRADFERKL